MMRADSYIKKINEICNVHENECKATGCPLFNYGCGLPKDDDEAIKKVISIVEKYKLEEVDKCSRCGYEFRGDHASDKFCPACGSER